MNIMVNTYCNLKCPYCFANSTMSECDKKEMSLENLLYILNFLKRNEMKQVRMIGGEPTLYTKLKEAINIVIDMGCFEDILIFSNFTFSRELCDYFIEVNKKIKLRFLPNINEFDLLSKKNVNNILYNFEKMAQYNENLNTIGINIYRPDMDLSQWDDIIQKAKGRVSCLRYSIAVPNQDTLNNNFDFYTYYSSFENVLWELIKITNKNNMSLFCDCNNVPPCCFSPELIKELYINNPISLGRDTKCSYPVIDIKPDLSFTSCFGFNHSNGKTLKDFDTYQDMKDYLNEYKHEYIARKECLDCIRYKTQHQSCACRSTHLIKL